MRSTTLTGLRAPLLCVVSQVRLKPLILIDTDFYAWGHETIQNSGMPWAKAKTSSGVLGPKMASGAISKHRMCVGIYMPLASTGMLTYALGYKYGGKPDQCNFASAKPEVYLYNTMDIDFIVFLCVCMCMFLIVLFPSWDFIDDD